MAIKGLTDRQASFPQVGILRKGAPKPERGPGRDLDYFRFDTDDEAARAMFHQVYGDEPRHINCYLPFSTAEENFFTAKEEWKSGGLVHRCDGEICSIWQTKDGAYSHELKPCPGGCSPVGRLKIIVPELRRFAYVTVQTTSINDIMTLQENLLAAEMIRQGDLRGIPFVLSRRPRMVSTPDGKGKRVRREKWLLSIEPSAAWVGLQLDQMKAEALGRGDMLELEPGEDDDRDNDEIGVIEEPPHRSPKPEKPNKPVTTATNGNGRKYATIASGFDFRPLATELAAACPHYANKNDDGPNMYHITLTAVECGFSEINADNAEVVIEALAAHYHKQVTGSKMPQAEAIPASAEAEQSSLMGDLDQAFGKRDKTYSE